MITVVLSVYNTGQYLAKAMEEIEKQTYRDLDIIVVDDGSTDGSAAICDAEAAGRDNVRVFHKPNGGLSSARNFGIDHAKGEFIIFPDPDDWALPDYLQKLLDLREEHNADLSICGHYVTENGRVYIWNGEAKPAVFDRKQALRELMLPESFCGYAWNKLFSMDVIRQHSLRFDEELGMVQDLHFAYRYLQFCDTIAYDPTPVFHYNRDAGGVTTYDSPLTPRKISGLKTYVKIADLAQNDGYPEIAAMSYAILCDTCLQYIYFYYHSHMRDPQLLADVRKQFSQYLGYLMKSDVYSSRRKLIAQLARVSPRSYYALFQSKRSIYDFFRGLRKKPSSIEN